VIELVKEAALWTHVCEVGGTESLKSDFNDLMISPIERSEFEYECRDTVRQRYTFVVHLFTSVGAKSRETPALLEFFNRLWWIHSRRGLGLSTVRLVS
jgi:hypothetical protein